MRSKKIVGMLAVLTLLIVAFATMVTPVSAAHDLKVTDYNRNKLYVLTAMETPWYSYGSGLNPQLLKWEYGMQLDAHGKSKNLVYVGSKRAIRIGNGQCVDFAKAMSNTGGVSSVNWTRGNRVFDYGNVAKGTVIATFSNPTTYYGHVAIFDDWHWTYSGGWIIDGFYVWDQNYVSPLLTGRHLIKRSGSGVGDADNYYRVRVP